MNLNNKKFPSSTTSKEKFLKQEFSSFKSIFVDYDKYLEVLGMDAIQCDTCKLFYWDGCLKRCNCN